MNLKQLLLIISAALTPSTLFAAPAITTPPAAVQHSSSITIGGTGFGVKSPAAPWLYDSFENETVGDGMDGKSPQIGTATYTRYATDGVEGVYANDRAYSGSQAAKTLNTSSGSTTRDHFAFRGQAAQKRFISYRVYGTPFDGVSKGDRQTANLDNGNAYDLYDSPPNFGYAGYMFTNNGAEFVNHGWFDAITPNRWQRNDQWIVISTPNVANGQYDYYVDGVLAESTGPYATCSSAATNGCQIDSWISPNFINKITTTPTFWIDDLYVDNTQARVELCSGSSWANRGNCNLQIPTAWSTTSVTATANTAGFTDAQEVFLYVVDADGLVNSLGVATEVGEGGGVPPDTTPPVLSLLAPSGTLAAGTTSTTISLVTDEAATCKYSATAGVAYASMTLAFDSSFALSHSATVSSLTNGGSYSRYVRCIDGAGNANTSDATISFSVASSAGTAGTLSWEYSTYSAERSDVRIPINIVRTGGSTGTVTAQWSSNGQTAVHDVDYYGNNNVTVTFADGVTSVPINVYGSGDNGILMVDNGADEDRYFQMILSNSTGGATLGTTLATVTIEGDYVPPVPGMRIGVGTSRVGAGSTRITPLQ